MRFRHDPRKAATNVRSMEFRLPMQNAEGEYRFVTIGLGGAGEVLVVVWTEREGECRMISARRPTRKERVDYAG